MARMRSSMVPVAAARMAFLLLGCGMLPRSCWCAKSQPARRGLASSAPERAAPFGEDGACGVVTGRPGDAAAGVRAGAAVVEAGERAAIVGVAQHRPRPEQLIERHDAVRDIAAG